MKKIFGGTAIIAAMAFGILLAVHLNDIEIHEQEQTALEAELKHFKEELVATAHKNTELEQRIKKIANDPNIWALQALGNASAGRVMLWLMLTTQQEANIKINKESCSSIMGQLVMMSKSFAEEGTKRGLSQFQVLYGLAHIGYELEFAEKLCNAVVGKPNQMKALKKVFP